MTTQAARDVFEELQKMPPADQLTVAAELVRKGQQLEVAHAEVRRGRRVHVAARGLCLARDWDTTRDSGSPLVSELVDAISDVERSR